MSRTTRFTRIALAVGIAAGTLIPASTALALSPPAPGPGAKIAIPEPTDPDPKPGDTIGLPAPGPTCKFVCIDDLTSGGSGPGDQPGDQPGDEPGDQPGDEPGDGGQGDSSTEGEVLSDTVVAAPNFTG